MEKYNCFLYASAGRFEKNALDAAKSNLSKYFSRVEYNHITPSGYFAGSEKERIEQFAKTLQSAEKSEYTPWIMPVRGGYGSIDVLKHFAEYRFPRKTVFSGFSDISVFLNYFAEDENVNLVYGMNALHSFTGKIDAVSMAYQKQLIRNFNGFHYKEDVLSQLEIINAGNGAAEGKIFGGCLSVILSTAGTRYFPDFNGKILFLEDVNEPVYAIDRMLNQLEEIGVLSGISGLIVGEFYGSKAQFGTTVKDVFEKYISGRGYPVVYNFPMGHGERHVPIKFGTPVKLEITGTDRANISYLN